MPGNAPAPETGGTCATSSVAGTFGGDATFAARSDAVAAGNRCRPSVLHCRRSRPEDDGRIVFSVQWSGVTYAGLVYVGLWRSAESPITRPILGYRSRSTKGERAGRLQHHRGATGPAPRQHGRRWCPLTPQPRRRAAVPLFIASHAALFTCLPESYRTARTPYIHPQTHHRAVDGGR